MVVYQVCEHEREKISVDVSLGMLDFLAFDSLADIIISMLFFF